MANPFEIRADQREPIKLGEANRGEVAFQVKNTSGRPIYARAVLIPDEPELQPGLTFIGQAERHMIADDEVSYTVVIAPPDNVPVGRYRFHLRVEEMRRERLNHADGPTITVEIGDPPSKPLPGLTLLDRLRALPRWIYIAAALVVVAIVVGAAFLLLRPKPLPDLLIERIEELPASEESINVHELLVIVSNHGNGPARGTEVMVDLPVDGPIALETKGNRRPVPPLEAGETAEILFVLGYTPVLDPEFVEFNFVVDPDNVIEELTEVNNRATMGAELPIVTVTSAPTSTPEPTSTRLPLPTQIILPTIAPNRTPTRTNTPAPTRTSTPTITPSPTPTPLLPDLFILPNISVDVAPLVGPIRVRWTIVNQGREVARNVEVRVIINAGDNSGDQFVVVNTLAPGQTIIRETEFPMRVPLLNQNIRVNVIADVNNRITEMNENNNAAAFSCRTDIFGQNCR